MSKTVLEFSTIYGDKSREELRDRFLTWAHSLSPKHWCPEKGLNGKIVVHDATGVTMKILSVSVYSFIFEFDSEADKMLFEVYFS